MIDTLPATRHKHINNWVRQDGQFLNHTYRPWWIAQRKLALLETWKHSADPADPADPAAIPRHTSSHKQPVVFAMPAPHRCLLLLWSRRLGLRMDNEKPFSSGETRLQLYSRFPIVPLFFLPGRNDIETVLQCFFMRHQNNNKNTPREKQIATVARASWLCCFLICRQSLQGMS